MTNLLGKLDSYLFSPLESVLQKLLPLLLGAAALIFFVYHIFAISHRYPLDYGEAPLVDQAIRLGNGGNIYCTNLDTPPFTISNYPPLYLVSMIPFLKLFGPGFWAGRLISTLSALAAGVFIWLIICRLTQDRLAGWISGLIFLAFPYVVGWSGLARVDLLALAFSLGGLKLLTEQPLSRSRFIGGGILLVAAIFTRQSYALAAPFAAIVWLLLNTNPSAEGKGKGRPLLVGLRQAILLALLVAGLSLALFGLLHVLTRGGFYFNIVTANVNEFGMDRLKWNLTRIRQLATPLLYSGAFSLLLLPRWNRAWGIAAPYLIGASLSALTIGKIGSNVNYFLELCAALSLVGGVLLAWSRNTKSHTLRVIVLAMLIFQTSRLILTTRRENIYDLKHRFSFTGELQQLENVVAEAAGPMLADEYMGLITLQDRPLVLQPFEVTQLAWAGVWNQQPLIESISRQEFSLVLIHYFPEYPVYKERWTKEMLDAISRYYVPTESFAYTTVYRPMGYDVPKESCPNAPWLLPTYGLMGVQWKEGGLDFHGWGNEGEVPVYAVADGLLTRLPNRVDAVAILHPDPLRPGKKVWTVYADMGGMDGVKSHVLPGFPPGTKDLPVRAGQLLGYQGKWSGRAMWPTGIHLHFAIVQAAVNDAFPEPLTPADLLDPSLYLGLALKPKEQVTFVQPLECKK